MALAIPPWSLHRSLAASISQPASEHDISIIEGVIPRLTEYNSQGPRVIHRDSTNDQDILEAVYRWDERDYNVIFRTGFPARDPGSTALSAYYSLDRHVDGGGAPTGTSPADGSVFVSTTRSTSWRPSASTQMTLYRYEIFAPGGIDMVLSLREHRAFPNQQEIAFVGGVKPQYIRSARPYGIERGSQPLEYAPVGNRIFHNDNFNPNPSTSGKTTQAFMDRLRNVNCPTREEYMINVVFRSGTAAASELPFVDPRCKVMSYVDCAFDVNSKEEAFIFTADQCMKINYNPRTTKDFIIKKPMSIGNFFPALRNTIFATGVDSAFTSNHTDEVYLFRNNLYVLFDYGSGKIIGGPKQITDGFPSLRHTIFEHGIDAAFASHRRNEAYLFKGDQYVLINYAPGTTNDYLLNSPQKITKSFPSLGNTVFADGLDAAFRAYATNEAYIFKGDTYALINYAPGTTGDKIIHKVTPITDGFSSLTRIIPWYPCGC